MVDIHVVNFQHHPPRIPKGESYTYEHYGKEIAKKFQCNKSDPDVASIPCYLQNISEAIDAINRLNQYGMEKPQKHIISTPLPSRVGAVQAGLLYTKHWK